MLSLPPLRQIIVTVVVMPAELQMSQLLCHFSKISPEAEKVNAVVTNGAVLHNGIDLNYHLVRFVSFCSRKETKSNETKGNETKRNPS